MRRVLRVVLALVVPALLVSVPAGCGRDEGKPNPELKVPDVAPSKRDQGEATKPPGKP